ncbi:MAG: ATP-binding protein [Promethearchaeota archaeon]
MQRKPERFRKQLTESEEKYKLILDNANDLITIINEDLVHEYINEKAYHELLGYKNNDIIGNSPLTHLHPDDRKIAGKLLREIFKDGEAKYEMRLIHKDGQHLWFEHKGKTFIDTDGKRKVLIISRDITERKKAENLILEENRKLMEISQIKSELVMKASHELKTPLSSIYGASQYLLKDCSEQFDAKALGFIEMICRSSQKLHQLIKNLLDASRVESGKLKLNLQSQNLVELVNDCCEDLKYWADKREIKFIIDLPDELIIKIDRIRIEQVFNNLLSNAIKYTPPKGIININLCPKSQYVDISISDTGIGLINKEKQLLFQKFGKIQRNLENFHLEDEGSGLGLYISKEIVEIHNGKILVESKGRDKGATFIVRLPRSK